VGVEKRNQGREVGGWHPARTHRDDDGGAGPNEATGERLLMGGVGIAIATREPANDEQATSQLWVGVVVRETPPTRMSGFEFITQHGAFILHSLTHGAATATALQALPLPLPARRRRPVT
jgi:hypothetical protein